MRGSRMFLTLVAAVGLLGASGAGGAPGGSAAERPIRLKSGAFLPSQGEPSLPPGLRRAAPAPGVRGVYLVQFVGPIEQGWKDAVAAAGGELLDYMPEFAFRVRMTPAQARAVRRLDPVRWVGTFHPGYKLSPRLARGGERLYALRLERGASRAAVAAAVRRAGVRVIQRGDRSLVVSAREGQIEALARQEEVAWIENFLLREKHNEYGGQVILGAQTANGLGYDGSTQTVAVTDTGIGGGTAATAHPDIPASRVASIFNWPGTPSPGCYSIPDDGASDVDTGHGTHVSGSILGGGDAFGRGKGTAPGAHLLFQAVENYVSFESLCSFFYASGYYLIGLPTTLTPVFQQSYDAGARIHSNSWGSPAAGEYTQDSQDVDDFAWSHRDLTITFSAGNEGVDADANGGVDGYTISSPATAKNVISVGATENDRASDYECDAGASAVCAAQGGQNQIFTYGAIWPSSFPAEPLYSDPSAGNAEQMAAFSGTGPTDDGRIKPDVVAPGTWVLSAFSDLYQESYGDPANPQNGSYQYPGWGYPQSAEYKYMGGTSMSNPLVAGGAAVVRDYYEKDFGHAASAALVKATLINSAVDLLDENNDGVDDNALPIPNFYEGWGRVDLAAATDGSRLFQEETTGLQTNDSVSYNYTVSAGTAFKVTLVWTDYPAALSSYSRLVNDLDLEVSGPGGVSYLGNVFAVSSGGWSLPDTGLPDRANNVENVYVQLPAAGTWTVTVKGFNVPQGPQPFALVVGAESPQVTYALTVTRDGSGAGTVTSVPPAIDCGATCSADFPEGTLVDLVATPGPGSAFSGWSGACTGTGSCSVTMDQARSVGATFVLLPPPEASIDDVAGSEGQCGTTELVFNVTLSHPSALTVEIGYATADATATAGEDYTDTSGTLTFDPGVVSLPVPVSTTGDMNFESDETFTVHLSGATNAVLVDDTGTGTILNDDSELPADVSYVEWTSLTGVSVCGPSLTKTAATGWGNAGAVSAQEIASGDGYVEFTASETTTHRMLGLSHGDSNASYNDIDFALYLYSGQILIYEAGAYRGNYGPFATGDTMRVEVSNGLVQYSRNGSVFYTSNGTPVYPLLVDAALYSTGATLVDVVVNAPAPPPPPPPPPGTEPVIWTAEVGVGVNGNSLTKTAATGWGNAGAISTQQIGSGDGYVEFTASETSTARMLGLSSGNSSASYNDIDFALCLYSGRILIYEAGAYRGSFGSFATGDTLRVEVTNGLVQYSRNGSVLYTSNGTPVYPLLVDTALYNTGATLVDVVINAPIAPPPPPPPPPGAVVWTAATGVSVDGNSLTKTAATGWGNAGAISTQQIVSGDGHVEFTASETNTHRMLGLSNGDSSASYNDIDFALYLYSGQVLIYEAGAYRGNYGPFASGDTMRVEVLNGVVQYSRNGSVFYTSNRTPVYPLLVDTALYSTGATLVDVVMSGAQ